MKMTRRTDLAFRPAMCSPPRRRHRRARRSGGGRLHWSQRLSSRCLRQQEDPRKETSSDRLSRSAATRTPCVEGCSTGKLLAFGGVLHESSPTCATHEALVERREHGRHDAVLPFPVHDRPDLQGDPECPVPLGRSWPSLVCARCSLCHARGRNRIRSHDRTPLAP
jgi:hypothetical protein